MAPGGHNTSLLLFDCGVDNNRPDSEGARGQSRCTKLTGVKVRCRRFWSQSWKCKKLWYWSLKYLYLLSPSQSVESGRNIRLPKTRVKGVNASWGCSQRDHFESSFDVSLNVSHQVFSPHLQPCVKSQIHSTKSTKTKNKKEIKLSMASILEVQKILRYCSELTYCKKLYEEDTSN